MNDLTLQTLLALNLKPAVGWLYIHLAAKATYNQIDATQEEMAAWAGVTRQTVRVYLAQLEAKALIQDVGGGRYVVRGLVHPPHPAPILGTPAVNGTSDVKFLHTGDEPGCQKILHAEGSDVKKVNISPESESKTLYISESDSESQTPAGNVNPTSAPEVIVAAVGLWGELPRSWHTVIDGYVAEFGAAWVLAAIRLGQGMAVGKRPRHPGWLRAVIANAQQEGKTASTLSNVTPAPQAKGTNSTPLPAPKTSSEKLPYPPRPEGWMPDSWKPGAQYYREDRPEWMFKLAWECHLDAQRAAS